MKKILRLLKCPPRPFAIIFGIFSIVAVAFVFGFHYWNQPAAYVIYLCSAYGLYLIVLNTIVPFGKYLVRLARKNPYIDRYFSDREFHARVKLYWGGIVNVTYAIFKMIVGIIYNSAWFMAIAVYYIALCTVWLMFPMNIALSGVIIQVVRNGKSYSYPGTIIFVVALYAFYRRYCDYRICYCGFRYNGYYGLQALT